MRFNIVAGLALAILICIILLQNKGCKPSPIKETRDTVVVYKVIRDTIPGKPIYIKGKTIKDTVWLTENKPDSTYKGLLKQYTLLGNNHYEKRVFKTIFSIKDYGSVTVYDTVKANSLVGNSIVTDLKIPTTTITVEKVVLYKAFYIGPELTGNKASPLNGIYGRALFKTKKDHIYSISGGWNGEFQLGGGMYFKIN